MLTKAWQQEKIVALTRAENMRHTLHTMHNQNDTKYTKVCALSLWKKIYQHMKCTVKIYAENDYALMYYSVIVKLQLSVKFIHQDWFLHSTWWASNIIKSKTDMTFEKLGLNNINRVRGDMKLL